MCYSDGARPPLPPVGGAAADHGGLTLTSSDGTRLGAYAARAQSPTGRGMVVLPDVRGLHTFYKELAVRFAEAGFEAVAIDYFGRTTSDLDRGESFDWKPQVEQTSPETIAADVRAAVDHLRSAQGGRARSVFTVGFCFGGATSWRQAANNGDVLSGAIGFYGGSPMARVGPWIADMRAPLLMLLAGADFTPAAEFDQFAEQVRGRGVEVESHTYAGAPHSFFDRTYEEWKDACEDAWRRILDFTERHSA